MSVNKELERIKVRQEVTLAQNAMLRAQSEVQKQTARYRRAVEAYQQLLNKPLECPTSQR